MLPFFLKAMRAIIYMYAKGASHGDIVERENRLELTYELDIVCLLYLHVGKGREGKAEGRQAGTGRRGGKGREKEAREEAVGLLGLWAVRPGISSWPLRSALNRLRLPCPRPPRPMLRLVVGL